jgi:hypothetical protein
MVVAAPTFFPEFCSSYASGIPGQTPADSGLDQASPVHRQQLSLPLCCKDDRNVFNHIQPLFSAFVSTNPLFSTPSSLFFAKQGGRGITMLPKSFTVSSSRYLQCSQQNTNSLHFFCNVDPLFSSLYELFP